MGTMKKNILKTLLLITILAYQMQVLADTLSYKNVLDKAINNSFDLKISNIDIDISKSTLKEAKSDYYPTLVSGFNYEYNRDLTDGQQVLTSVGTSVVSTNTRYQDLLSLKLSYNLYDFGIRGKKVSIAKKDIAQKELVCFRNTRELKLKILDLYTKALQAYNEIKLKGEILPLSKELMTMQERLYQAGSASRVDIMDEAIKIARLMDSIDKTKSELKSSLKDLSLYTMEEYDADNVKLENYADYDVEQNIVPISNKEEYKPLYKQKIEQQVLLIPEIKPEKTVEYKIYKLEIEKKMEELEITKKEKLPQLGLYSNYSFYGSDKSEPFNALDELKESSFSIGITAGLPIFDGFKNTARREKLESEIKRLELERDRKVLEIKNQYEKLQQASASYRTELENKEKILFNVRDMLADVELLAEYQIVDKKVLLNQKKALIEQQLDLEKSIVNNLATIKNLEILAEDYE